MYELERIRALETGLTEIRRRIKDRYPNGAPSELRELYGIAADAIRKSDELAGGRVPTGDSK